MIDNLGSRHHLHCYVIVRISSAFVSGLSSVCRNVKVTVKKLSHNQSNVKCWEKNQSFLVFMPVVFDCVSRKLVSSFGFLGKLSSLKLRNMTFWQFLSKIMSAMAKKSDPCHLLKLSSLRSCCRFSCQHIMSDVCQCPKTSYFFQHPMSLYVNIKVVELLVEPLEKLHPLASSSVMCQILYPAS